MSIFMLFGLIISILIGFAALVYAFKKSISQNIKGFWGRRETVIEHKSEAIIFSAASGPSTKLKKPESI